MMTYPEPIMPRSTRHLAVQHTARRAQLERAALATIAAGRKRSLARCANCRGVAMCERWCPEFIPE